MKMRRILTSYSDGAYGWRDAAEYDDPKFIAEVPESTVALWIAVADLDRVVQRQIRAIDEAVCCAVDETGAHE